MHTDAVRDRSVQQQRPSDQSKNSNACVRARACRVRCSKRASRYIRCLFDLLSFHSLSRISFVLDTRNTDSEQQQLLLCTCTTHCIYRGH